MQNKWSIKKCVIVIIMTLFTTIVLAFAYIRSGIKLNGKYLPELDQLEIVKANLKELKIKDNSYIDELKSYTDVEKILNVELLNADDKIVNINQSAEIYGDNDWIRILVKDYCKPQIDIEVQLVLSQSQLDRGLNEEYLGYYEFEDSFISKQGYKVNILRTTGDYSEKSTERIAIFVARGMQYELSGKVSKDEIIEIVNSMI